MCIWHIGCKVCVKRLYKNENFVKLFVLDHRQKLSVLQEYFPILVDDLLCQPSLRRQFGHKNGNGLVGVDADLVILDFIGCKSDDLIIGECKIL